METEHHFIGVNDTAKLLMVSPTSVREMPQRLLTVYSTDGGHRRYLYDDVIKLAHKRVEVIVSDIINAGHGKKLRGVLNDKLYGFDQEGRRASPSDL